MSLDDKARNISFYKRLLEDLNHSLTPLPTAVIFPTNLNTLKGAVRCAEKNLIQAVLVGPVNQFKTIAKKNNLDLSGCKFEEATDSQEAVNKSISLVLSGRVQALMKGYLPTHQLMHGVINNENNLRTRRYMSHVFVIDVPDQHYPKPLFISDAAVIIQPNLEQKKDIIQNAIDLFIACNNKTAKVALLSATQNITSSIPSTIEAVALCKMAERGEITGGIIEGPLSFDCAISRKAAEIKKIKSKVPGEVDILIVPNLESGNILYKQMKYLSGYDAAGLVMGASVPIILTSRSAGDTARMASAALALRYLNGKKEN